MHTELRLFRDHDWDGFAGAENLPDGTLPRIAESDDNWVVVVSGAESGACVQVFAVNGTCYSRDFAEQAAAFVDALNMLRAGVAVFLTTTHDGGKYTRICDPQY